MDVNKRIENIEYVELYAAIYSISKEFKKYGYYFDNENVNCIMNYSEVIAKGLQKTYQFFTWGEVNQIFNGILSGSIELVEKRNTSIAKYTPENLFKLFASHYHTAIFKKKADEWEQKRDTELTQLFTTSPYGKAVAYRLGICKTKPALKRFFLEDNSNKTGYKITTDMIAECLQSGQDPELLINN